MDEITSVLINDAINIAMNYYGIEGAIEKITDVYKQMPEIQKAMLENINQRLR